MKSGDVGVLSKAILGSTYGGFLTVRETSPRSDCNGPDGRFFLSIESGCVVPAGCCLPVVGGDSGPVTTNVNFSSKIDSCRKFPSSSRLSFFGEFLLRSERTQTIIARAMPPTMAPVTAPIVIMVALR